MNTIAILILVYLCPPITAFVFCAAYKGRTGEAHRIEEEFFENPADVLVGLLLWYVQLFFFLCRWAFVLSYRGIAWLSAPRGGTSPKENV